MAISTIDTPQALTPAFNPMYFYFDSTNKAELGFRYLIEVVNVDTTEIIGTYSLKPIPTSLYGEVDIRKIIQSEMFKDFQLLKAYIPQGHQIKYELNVNEEYFVNVNFSDYLFAGSGSWPNVTDPSINPGGFARVMIDHVADPGFSAGDTITIAQTPSANYRPELEGIHMVLDVFESGGTWYTVLNLLWIGSGPASAGVASYADGLKTIFEGITTSEFTAFRGAFTFMNFKDYDHTTYLLNSADSKLLTTLPTTVRISRNMPSWLSGDFVTGTGNYIVFNIDGTLYRYSVGAIEDILLFNVLPSDATIEEVFTGTWDPFGGGLDLTDIETFTVQVFDGAVEASEEVTITLYDECDRFTTYDLCFMDRHGSWITIPFNKGDYITQDVQKQSIRKKYSGLNQANEWAYEGYDTGTDIYHVEESINYMVNTGILSEVECQYMRELLSTPQAFVSVDGGEWQAIDILTANIPLHKKRTKRDRKVSINFMMSIQDEING